MVFEGELAGSAVSVDEAKELAAKGLADRPRPTKSRPAGEMVGPKYTGPKMTVKPVGRKLSAKERVELAVADGRISVDTARRLLTGDLSMPQTSPSQVHRAEAIEMATQISDLARPGGEDKLRVFLGRQNTSALKKAARVLGLKTGQEHTAVVDAIAAHVMAAALAVKKAVPDPANLPNLEGLSIRAKRARLKALGFTPEQINELAPTAAAARKAAAAGGKQARSSVGFERYSETQPRDPGGEGGGQWVDTGKIFDAAGKLLGHTEEGIFRDLGLTVHRVDFGDDDDLHVGLHESDEVALTSDLPYLAGSKPEGRQLAYVTDRENAKDLAGKIRWAEENFSELDEEEIDELVEQRDGYTSSTSTDELIEFDRTDDGVIVGYDPVDGIVVYFPKDGVDEPREDHLDEDFESWALQPGHALDFAYALEEVADLEPEQHDTYSAGRAWDLTLWTDFDVSVTDDGGESWAATFNRRTAEYLLEHLSELRDAGAGVDGASEVTRQTGVHTIVAGSDGTVAVSDRWSGEPLFTIPTGGLGAMIDALDEATYEARLAGGYKSEWDADKEAKPEPSARAARLAVSIVDTLIGGRYTAQQKQARRGWLDTMARFWKPGDGVPFKKNDHGQWVDRYGKFADLPDLLKPAKAADAPKKAPAGKAARKPRGDVPTAIGRLESLRQDLPSDAREQSRQILAGLTGPQLKQVADHFGVPLYGRLIKDKRQNLEHSVVGARSDHKAIMGVDMRVADTIADGPALRMTLKEAKRQTLLDAVHGHADLAEAEHGELYQKIREGVDSGKWGPVQGRWAAVQAEKQLLKQSGAAIAQQDGEKVDRLSKLAGRYAKLAEDIQISDSVVKTGKYTNPRSGDEPLRPDGPGALAQVPAGGVLPDDASGGVLPDAGRPDRVPDRRPRRPAGAAGAGGSAIPGADGPDDGREVAGGAGSAGGDAATGGGGRDRRVDAPVFRPHGQEDLAPATEKQRLVANLEALRTLRTIQSEDRPATAEEQAKLARWSGWGSLPGVFKEPPDSRYAAAQESLKLLLSPAEFAAARRTTRNAHYTDAGYVRAIWDAMRKLGFEGGQVLEPGSGSGTFVGLVPDEISADTHVTGVELDPITAAVSRALYPNQDVRTESFAESKVDDGSFDAAIGNVPFSDTKLFDPEYNPGRRHNMHNHFILKSLRMTRPGGLVSVITSRYTMDSLRPDAREDMAELGDLVGAVRLPSGAHERAAGTAVVTDLLVFRRREPGTPYAGLPFEQTRTVAVDGKDIAVNELFVDQDGNATDMVLGTFGAVHGMRGKDDLTVKGAKDAEPTLREALDRLVAQAQAKGLTQTAGRSPRPEFATTGRARKPDGYLQAREDGTFTRLVRGVEQPHKVPSTQTEELRQLLRLRDTAMALIDAEATSVDDTDEMKRLREELNEIYDSYVANPKWGPVSRFTETRAKGSGEDDVEEERVTRRRPPQGGFRADPFSAVVRSLEIYDPVTGTA
ncbi:MAG TPA: hypothetical protein DGT23_33710, partial [Micromonosporaceae bacterium]|nr:hypothetical protein [Micromonosporaceae bacterium]